MHIAQEKEKKSVPQLVWRMPKETEQLRTGTTCNRSRKATGIIHQQRVEHSVSALQSRLPEKVGGWRIPHATAEKSAWALETN